MPVAGLASAWPRAMAKFMIWRRTSRPQLALTGAVRLYASNHRLTRVGGDAVERDRPELRQQLAREEREVAFFRGRLVAREMRVLPLALDERPERGGAASGHALLLGLLVDLPREAITARLRDSPE